MNECFWKKFACNDQDHHPDYEPEAETRHHVKQRQSRSSNRTSSGTSASHGKYAIVLVYVKNIPHMPQDFENFTL